MSDNVIIGDFNTTLDLPVDRILNDALKSKLKQVVVCGLSEDDTFIGWATNADVAQSLLLLELGKHQLMSSMFED